MIYSIGIDIIEIERIESVKKLDIFLKKNFTENEIKSFSELKKPYARIAGYFAMKEAVSKAIGTGIGRISLIDIEILKDINNKPYVNYSVKLKELMNELGVSIIHINCSHSENYAVANAIAEI